MEVAAIILATASILSALTPVLAPRPRHDRRAVDWCRRLGCADGRRGQHNG